MEVMSFGALSKMYHGMLRPDQRIIARRYGVQSQDLVTILHHLVYVRNLCAHHSRLWDRTWAIKPSLPKGQAWQPHVPTNDRLFTTLLLLYSLMNRCPAVRAFATAWRDRVHRAHGQSALGPHGTVPDGNAAGLERTRGLDPITQRLAKSCLPGGGGYNGGIPPLDPVREVFSTCGVRCD